MASAVFADSALSLFFTIETQRYEGSAEPLPTDAAAPAVSMNC